MLSTPTWFLTHDRIWRFCAFAVLFVFLTAGPACAQDRTVLFGVSEAGVSKAATNWGLDTAWYDENNLRRGAAFMGSNRVDVVRISFTTTNALVAGQLGAVQLNILTNRLTWVDRWANPATKVCINEDSPTIDPWYYDGSVVNSTNWAANIVAHAKRAKEWGRTVVAVAPFNEPDFYRAERQASMQKFYDTAGFLVTNSLITTNNIRISGGNTLNTDQANSWYNFLKARLDEGNTHQLAGSFDNFASLFQNAVTSGDHATDDEMHNVMEAMVGAEYGMNTGIWWGTAERARGEFVKASEGVRLGYAEHRANWTAASVYRGTNGVVQAFVGESERQALPTTYRFFSKDRDVFYDGDGPRRDYTATTTGDSTYQSTAHRNAETVVNITWGADVPPAINGRYLIVNRNSGKVLQVPGSSTANGVQLTQNSFTNGLNQQWDVNPLPNTFGGDYSYFTIKPAHSGFLADLNNWSFANGEKIQQWNGGTNALEQWYFQYTSNGYFKIRNRWSNKVMGVNGASTANGALILQWDDNGTLDHEWRFIPTNAAVEFVAPAAPTLLAATASAVSVQLNWNTNSESDLAGYTVLRATNSGGPYEIVARGLTNNVFTDKSANQPRTYFYVVKAADKSLNNSGSSAQVGTTPTGASALVARYAFDENTNDSSVNANHPIVTSGSPTFVAGKYGSALDLSATDQYTMLPANMLASVTNFTIALWVNWDGGAAWQRIFDFGNDTTQYMFLTPGSGSGTLRFAITTNGGGAEQILQTSPLPVGQWQHVAITRNGNAARLYTNGVLAVTNVINITPTSFNPVLNYLGKSQYADPLFNGRLDELYIYNYALSDSQIIALANSTGVPPTPTGLATTPGNNQVGLGWSASAGATSYNVKRATVNGGPYGTISTPTTTNYTDAMAGNGTNYYYVVSAVNISGEGTNSSQVSAMPVPPIPPTPTGLIANSGDNQVGLSWAVSSGATSYNVKRSVTNGGVYTTMTNVTTTACTDSGMVNGTTYYYVVSAVNIGGESADSTQVGVTPSSTAPVTISLSLSGGALNFSWPPDHIGWRLQVQTNALDAGLGANWFDVPGSVVTNRLSLPVDGNSGSVFYQLIYP